MDRHVDEHEPRESDEGVEPEAERPATAELAIPEPVGMTTTENDRPNDNTANATTGPGAGPPVADSMLSRTSGRRNTLKSIAVAAAGLVAFAGSAVAVGAADSKNNDRGGDGSGDGKRGGVNAAGSKNNVTTAAPAEPTGPTGPKGNKGAHGASGPKGNKGADGVDGASGPKGNKGADGVDGASGPKGNKGADGADGAS